MGYKNFNLPKENEEFPNGLILISGNNSYGKSTILQGILLAFFGPKIFRGRNAASFITYGESKAELYIFFILDNIKYYIFRKWGRTGSSSSKLFKMDKLGVFQEIKKFNIEKFFEISRDQALSTVFVRQGEVEELANKRGAELRQMIIDLFHLDIIDDSLNFLDKESKSKKYEKSELEKAKVPIERIEEDIIRIEQENENFKIIIANKQKSREELEVKIKTFPSSELISNLELLYRQNEITTEKYESYKKDFENKINSINLNLNNFSSLEKIIITINTLNDSKNEIESKKKEIDEKRQATNKGMGKTKGRIEDITGKIIKMKNSLKFISKEGDKETAKCPTCQSELTKEHYDHIIQEFNKKIELNQKKVEKIAQLINDFEKEIKSLQKDIDIVNRKITIISSLKGDFENYQKYDTESKEVQKKLSEFLTKHRTKFSDVSSDGIKNLAIEIERISTKLKGIKQEIKEKQEDFKSNHRRMRELREEIEKMKNLENKINKIEVDIIHIDKAKEFVRRFVTEYMVVKRLVKNIALKTDKYIKDFTAGQYGNLLIDLTGTKKTGLSIKIKDNFNGQYESIEILSGGDRTALGMALRLAISELMSIIRPTKDSPKRNPKIDFLLLDEPLAALDEIRRERILKHLTKSKTFSQVFLITHTAIPPEIQTNKIIVEKDHSTGLSYARFEKQIIAY
jgi:exonuclease SbcC